MKTEVAFQRIIQKVIIHSCIIISSNTSVFFPKTHILDGNAYDLVQECEAFEEKIKEAGGIELFIGGIGPDGHIAFNEPGSSLVSRTRVKTLAQDTITRLLHDYGKCAFFRNDSNQVSKQAFTVGVETVMEAREVMILILAAHKAFALYKAIEDINHMWTVSAFQTHPRSIFLCDEDATLELRVKFVKYFKVCDLFLKFFYSISNLPAVGSRLRGTPIREL
uniref:Uncharacterized protein n=1 Tax=Strigamia maritima TaxID=126957 RepID=T1IJU4_STRMM